MAQTNVISLGIHRTSQPDEELDWLRAFVDQSLILLRDLLVAGGESERIDLGNRLDQCRAMLAADDEEGVVRAQCAQVLARVREVVNHARQQEVDRKKEMGALVTLVREAVITVGAEVGGLHETVEQSAGRFQALSALDDPRLIKERLAEEVKALKHAAAERRQVWESTSKKFTERVEALERQLITSRTEASLDSLTGVANRRTFDKTLHDWVRSAKSCFVLAMLDLDDFKTINDTRGHAAGDQVLIGLAHSLLTSVRPGDVVARLGGDEFAILASDLTLRQAENRFSKTVADLGHSGIAAKVSCGLAEFSAGDTYESLYERADQALYAAKRGGKHRVATKARAFIRDLMKR